jgi:hypothetical protein
VLSTFISGGTQTKVPPSIAAHIASNAIDFFRVMKKSQLLPLNAADRAWSNPIGIEKGGETSESEPVIQEKNYLSTETG